MYDILDRPHQMDYDLYKMYPEQYAPNQIRPTQIEMAVRAGWAEDGEMPYSMLIDKFEETNMDTDEEAFNMYAREQMMDRRPDTNRFEHEEPRGAVNQRYGKLQLQYYGHRGKEDVDLPERNLQFIGDDAREPRGINVDPDFKELNKQEQARMRFHRFSKDHSDFVIDSHRSERREIADNLANREATKRIYKVFDRQLDGRDPETHRLPKNHSPVCYQVPVQSYGDHITDMAINNKRKANILCNKLIRNSMMWRRETSDQEYRAHSYADAHRKGAKVVSHDRVLAAKDSQDGQLGTTDTSLQYKALGLLMKQACDNRANQIDMLKYSDCDYGTAKQTLAFKQSALTRDITAILQNTKQDSEFGTSDNTTTAKQAKPVQQKHTSLLTTGDSVVPPHHYHNAEIISKSVQMGKDLSAVREHIVSDTKTNIAEDGTAINKNARLQMTTGSKLRTTEEAHREHDSTRPHNYKLAPKAKNVSSVDQVNIDHTAQYTHSDLTHVRKNPAMYHNELDLIANTEHGMEFRGNEAGDRTYGALGAKYMTRYIDTDGRIGNVAAGN